MVGVALLLQINIVRSLVGLDIFNPCFYCREPDFILGAIVPVLCFVVIIIKLRLSGKVKYVLDYYDVYFASTILVLFLTSIYSKDFINSIGFSLKYIFLGSSYYFISKIILINVDNPYKQLKSFFIWSLGITVIFGLLGTYLYIFKGEFVYRLTLPGVHAIPFSQLIGLGVFVSFLIFLTSGRIFDIQSKFSINLNKVLLPVTMLILFGTNTRGVMLSLAVAIIFYLYAAKVKIPKRTLYISGGLILAGLIVVINYIELEVLFSRILAKQTNESTESRYIAYIDSLDLFIKHPLGIGPSSFKYYSSLPYPHNLILENIAEYGVFGLLNIVYLFCIILYMFKLTITKARISPWFIIIFSLFLYYFFETMFSFTLWMHKGMYLFMGVFAAHHYLYRKNK